MFHRQLAHLVEQHIDHDALRRRQHHIVDKPFTLDAREAQALVALATRRGLKLTVGHDDQFSHVARRMRDLVRSGYLGGSPVHMESTYCYDLRDGYARAQKKQCRLEAARMYQ